MDRMPDPEPALPPSHRPAGISISAHRHSAIESEISHNETVSFPRSSGILLHPTSLPGRFGVGDLGPEAYRYVDFLASAGQKIWQVLPLGPTGYGDSPYQLFSAFAGNPLLISLERLADDGLLTQPELEKSTGVSG